MRAKPRLLEGNLTIQDILTYGTPEIDVLAIMNRGERYAIEILKMLEGRGKLFRINPHNLHEPYGPTHLIPEEEIQKYVRFLEGLGEYLQNPGTNPTHTIVICDDVIEGEKDTFRRVRDHLTKLGYNFNSDNPPHFGAIECVITNEEIGYTDTSGLEYNQIRLVREFWV